jgi:hypothetical protein
MRRSMWFQWATGIHPWSLDMGYPVGAAEAVSARWD